MAVDNLKKIKVLYEGDCTFCNWCRDFVLERDREAVFMFIDLRSAEGRGLIDLYQLPISPAVPDSIAVIIEEGRVLYKWEACLYICSRLTPTLAFLGRFLDWFVPVQIGNKIYGWVGRHRGLLCKLVRCNQGGAQSNKCES